MIISLILTTVLFLGIANTEEYFKEEFSDDKWNERWIQSEHSGVEWGKFLLSHGKFYGDAEKDKGIQTSQDARFYGLSTKFAPFSNQGKDLVIQFTVKFEQDIDCGGGYMKVFDCSLDSKDMHGDTPYLFMFGPDICGPGTKRVHVIINYKDKNMLINKDIRCKDDTLTHLYTLIIRPDNTYVVNIDNEKAESGDLEADWDFLAPKKIKDPEAKKPEDWDDNPKLDDPEDTKPEDWEQPEYVPDPDAVKPEDWDDEMDGEWEPPQINNPSFKGEWKPRQIDNPNYKGHWVHPEIDNPEYKPDSELYLKKEICGVGFDLWQVKSGTIFDNILITDSESEAEEYGKQTWGATKGPEKKMKEKLEEDERKATQTKSQIDEEDEDDDDDDDEDNEIDSPDVVGSEDAADDDVHDEL